MISAVTANLFQRRARDSQERFGLDRKKATLFFWKGPGGELSKIIEAVFIELRRLPIPEETERKSSMHK